MMGTILESVKVTFPQRGICQCHDGIQAIGKPIGEEMTENVGVKN